MLGLRFRDALPGVVLDEFENVVSTVKGWISSQHNDDGTHGDVTADSVALQGAAVGEFVDLPATAARFTGDGSGTWAVDDADVQFLRYSRIGQVVFLEFCINGSVTTLAPEYLVIKLPEFAPLFEKQVVALSAAHGTVHHGGSWFFQDNVAPFTTNHGICAVVTVNSGAQSAAELHLFRPGGGALPSTADLFVSGSTTFAVNVDNIPNPFPTL